MNIFQAIILGVVQGLTEFLPVSSSGHLVITQKLFGFGEPPIFFDILVHVATLSALLVFFLKDLKHLNNNLIKTIVIGSIPTMLIGLVLNQNKHALFNSLPIVGFGLIVTSIFLFSTYWLAEKNRLKISVLDALVVGTMQGLAIIPGISRSGATIVTSLWLGLRQDQAFRFSFLLSVPAIVGAQLLELKDISTLSINPLPLLIGFSAAFITGFFALSLLKSILTHNKLHLFGFYTLLVSLATLLVVRELFQ